MRIPSYQYRNFYHKNNGLEDSFMYLMVIDIIGMCMWNWNVKKKIFVMPYSGLSICFSLSFFYPCPHSPLSILITSFCGIISSFVITYLWQKAHSDIPELAEQLLANYIFMKS